jgi:hypothetical protein
MLHEFFFKEFYCRFILVSNFVYLFSRADLPFSSWSALRSSYAKIFGGNPFHNSKRSTSLSIARIDRACPSDISPFLMLSFISGGRESNLNVFVTASDYQKYLYRYIHHPFITSATN